MIPDSYRTKRPPRARIAAAAVVALLMLGLGASASAQEGARDVAPLLSFPEHRAPLVEDDLLIPSMEGDDEFGELLVIDRHSNWQNWYFGWDSSAVWTDNVTLAPTDTEEDSYLLNVATLSYLPAITGNLFFNAAVRQEVLRYDERSDLDFEYLQADLGLMYVPSTTGGPLDFLWQDMAITGGYGYYRITEDEFNEDLLSDHLAHATIQKTYRPARGHELLLGTIAELSLAGNPETSSRHEFRWYAGYNIDWTERLSSGVMYSGAYHNYRGSDRADWNNYLGANVRFALLQGYSAGTAWQLAINVHANYTHNNSNEIDLDYENLSVGAGLGLRMNF